MSTTRVRIAVHVLPGGHWYANGNYNIDDSTKKYRVHYDKVAERSGGSLYWVELDLPIPEPQPIPAYNVSVAKE